MLNNSSIYNSQNVKTQFSIDDKTHLKVKCIEQSTRSKNNCDSTQFAYYQERLLKLYFRETLLRLLSHRKVNLHTYILANNEVYAIILIILLFFESIDLALLNYLFVKSLSNCFVLNSMTYKTLIISYIQFQKSFASQALTIDCFFEWHVLFIDYLQNASFFWSSHMIDLSYSSMTIDMTFCSIKFVVVVALIRRVCIFAIKIVLIKEDSNSRMSNFIVRLNITSFKLYVDWCINSHKLASTR